MVMLYFSDRTEVPKHVLVRFLEKESLFLNLETEQSYRLDDWYAHVASGHGGAEYWKCLREVAERIRRRSGPATSESFGAARAAGRFRLAPSPFC